MTRALASTTPRLRSPHCCAAPRRTSWPTATPAAWPARSAMPRCRRRTRWSSSSGTPRRSWRTRPDSVQVTSIAAAAPFSAGDRPVNPKGLDYIPAVGGIQPSGIDLILSVVALAMLAPVLIFIATATRLSAARREQRFAAMRLVGATRKQVSLLAATESTVAAVLGVAAGFGIFFLLRAPRRGHPVPRRAVLPRRHVAQPAGHPRGRDRRTGGRRRGGPAGAAPGAHLPARRRPPDDAEAAAGLADAAAAGRPGRARLLRRARHPGDPRAASSGRSCPASCSSSSAWSSRARGSPWPRRGSWPGGPAALPR